MKKFEITGQCFLSPSKLLVKLSKGDHGGNIATSRLDGCALRSEGRLVVTRDKLALSDRVPYPC